MLVNADGTFFTVGMQLHVGAVTLHFPDISGIGQLQIKYLPKQGLVLRGGNGGAYFHPAFQVALHEIGGTDIVFFVAVIFKIKNPGMFEKSADQGNDPDVFRQAFNARAQTAGVTDNEIDMDSGLGGAVQGFDDISIDQGIGFELDKSLIAFFLMVYLPGRSY